MTDGSNTPSPSDGDLLAAYAAGDARAAAELTRRLAPRVLAQARRMLGQQAEAEDVTQEAMLRLWRAAPDWVEEGAQVSTWLYRVTANLCTDRLRRGGRNVALDAAPEPVDEAATPMQELQRDARAQALRTALADLPERQAQAVALRHFEGLGNSEIAAIMDITPEAVESLTARGKRALAAALSPRRTELGVL
ncbi:MAG: RNA polymerase subunit sigma [Rhodobacterales bacterium]|nr:MAG: RNA polymerase subunit sigma [Rhodobacterales bacterium]